MSEQFGQAERFDVEATAAYALVGLKVNALANNFIGDTCAVDLPLTEEGARTIIRHLVDHGLL